MILGNGVEKCEIQVLFAQKYFHACLVLCCGNQRAYFKNLSQDAPLYYTELLGKLVYKVVPGVFKLK